MLAYAPFRHSPKVCRLAFPNKEAHPMLSLDDARQLLADHQPASHCHGYPDEVRQQVAVLIQHQLEDGASSASLGRQLGIAQSTVLRWAREHARPESQNTPTFLPVQLSQAQCTGFTIVTPGGHRLQGLDLQQAVAALEMLG